MVMVVVVVSGGDDGGGEGLQVTTPTRSFSIPVARVKRFKVLRVRG